MCDSFSYYEKEKQCIFDSVGSDFPSKALSLSEKSDFSERAFYRFCFPGVFLICFIIFFRKCYTLQGLHRISSISRLYYGNESKGNF